MTMDRTIPPHNYEAVAKNERVVESDSEAVVPNHARKHPVYRFARQHLGIIIVTILVPVVVFVPVIFMAVIHKSPRPKLQFEGLPGERAIDFPTTSTRATFDSTCCRNKCTCCSGLVPAGLHEELRHTQSSRVPAYHRWTLQSPGADRLVKSFHCEKYDLHTRSYELNPS